MKLRLIPILAGIIVTSAVLFGGWFIYQQFGVEKPLIKAAEGIEGVQKAEVSVTKEEATVRLKLKPDANLKEVVQTLKKEGEKYLGKRKLKLEVTGEASPELEKLWQDALFQVSEAMETKRYSLIPQTLAKLGLRLPGLKTYTDMDDENIYVRLNLGEHSKFVILPRNPDTMEVFSPQ